MWCIVVFLAFGVLRATHGSLNPPSYFPRCCVDKYLNKCWQDNMNNLRMVVRGDPIYNMPNMSPLQQEEFSIINNENGTFTFRPVRIAGFDDMITKNVSFDLDNGTYKANVTMARFTISGPFSINYTLQNTTIKGSDSGSVTFINLQVYLHYYFNNNPCGHPLVRDATANYTAETTKYNLGSIDATQMNNNTQQVYQDSYKQVSARQASMLTLQFQSLAELVPLYNLVNFHCCRPHCCHGRRGYYDGNHSRDMDRHGYCCDTYLKQCCRHHSGDYCKRHFHKHCVHRHCKHGSSSSESDERSSKSISHSYHH